MQQWSVDVQHELPGSMAVGFNYSGARGDDLGLGGTIDSVVNINQLDPSVLNQFTPAQLLERVPNPFFGIAEAGPMGGLATIERGQLLRPFPQFRDVNLRQVTAGKSRYHSVTARFDKRLSQGWGGRFFYTWSRLRDNQFGETNHFAARPGVPQNNFDLDAEFANGLLDMPHRLVLAPMVELPFGQGRAFATGGLIDRLVGGWTVSAVASFESGFPTAPAFSTGFSQNNLALFGNVALRPNLTGVDPETSGSTQDRLGQFVNPAAFEQPPVGTFGTAPRTLTSVRTPTRRNLDLVFQKDTRIGGSARGQVRLEFLNITNTPKFRDFSTTLDSAVFGQITRQSGFMRITQLSFRFTF